MPRETTPLMTQYRNIKQKHPDCVLLFRVGDFYETFYEDAIEVSSILNIALTTRDKKKENPIPLAGVPFHAAENYITKLLSAGKKVAVCEQMEDPAKAQGLVRREVIEILTPGTAMNPQLLNDKEHNYLLCLYLKDMKTGVALVDVSTGDFLCGQENIESLHYLLQGKDIKEIICNNKQVNEPTSMLLEALGNPFITEVDEHCFTEAAADEALGRQFPPSTGVNISNLKPLEKMAAGALLHHCHELRGDILPQVVTFREASALASMALDEESIGNLELLKSLRGGDPKATLLRVLDHTMTSMGGREIKEWLQKPLASVVHIERRLEAVSEIYSNPGLHEEIVLALKSIADLRRLATRIAARKAIPRELLALMESLERIPSLISALEKCATQLLCDMRRKLKDHSALSRIIERSIVPDPPGHLREGGVIKKGFSVELDDLIEKSEDAKRWIASLEKRERENTDIGSLKVGYNKVFGYYIEVSRAHLDSVPEEYIPKQTLVNAERYYTSELKNREQLILENESRRIECEQQIFDKICEAVAREMPQLQETADGLATVDVLQSLALAARNYGYKKPIVDDSRILEIVGGRHPVLERVSRETFVPNDLYLDPERKHFALLTGPNMSGKSTFLRQIALIAILAQMGSFVPAERARIGVIDKIFTRVGATDRLSRGQSTFLVEMNETSRILTQMTDRSLILLDEIGRGTSTFDGLSIAWAVTEYILQGVRYRPKTLFATHFHELTQLRYSYSCLVNMKITIKEWEGGIIFQRKVVPGTSDKSYGIHTAKVAGLPPELIKRAQEILQSLEIRRNLLYKGVDLEAKDLGQFTLFSQPADNTSIRYDISSATLSDIKDMLKSFDVDRSTPLEALQLIKEVKARLSSK